MRQVLEGVHQWVGTYKDFFRVTALPEVMSVQDKTPQTVLLTSCKGFLERVERAGAKTLEVRHTPFAAQVKGAVDVAPRGPLGIHRFTCGVCVQKGLDGVLRQLERVHREYITKTDYLPKDAIIELQVTTMHGFCSLFLFNQRGSNALF